VRPVSRFLARNLRRVLPLADRFRFLVSSIRTRERIDTHARTTRPFLLSQRRYITVVITRDTVLALLLRTVSLLLRSLV